ncbi:MAG: hypothetical protein V3U84_02760 [Thiotrichaceae bacterium]
MNPVNKYYARELLESVKESLVFKHFGGAWEKRDLPWLLTVWPFRVFIRQWDYIPAFKSTPASGQLIKFRRYYAKETNPKYDQKAVGD